MRLNNSPYRINLGDFSTVTESGRLTRPFLFYFPVSPVRFLSSLFCRYVRLWLSTGADRFLSSLFCRSLPIWLPTEAEAVGRSSAPPFFFYNLLLSISIWFLVSVFSIPRLTKVFLPDFLLFSSSLSSPISCCSSLVVRLVSFHLLFCALQLLIDFQNKINRAIEYSILGSNVIYKHLIS